MRWATAVSGLESDRRPLQPRDRDERVLVSSIGRIGGSRMVLRIVETADDGLLADFYRRHWLEMGFDEAEIALDWRESMLRFVADARAGRGFAGFVAVEGEEPVGGACCHLVNRVYPAFGQRDAAVVGYVWDVYVRPESRGRGVGTALVEACVGHLAGLGCGRVLLHAGERARPLYERLGFRPTDELALAIPPAVDAR